MLKQRIKTIITIIILIAVISSCCVISFASATSSTYLVWNALETKVSCVTEGSAPTGYTYYVYADITSNSTQMHGFSYTNANNGGSASTTAGPVNVTYPSPIPLVDFYGGWAPGLYSGYFD